MWNELPISGLRKERQIDLLKWLWSVIGLLVIVSAWIHFSGGGQVLEFVIASLAIIPLAGLIGMSTEAIATHAGPRLGGLLSATFGNAVELIIGIFALRNGLTTLVKASITGSILGNLLFVLGLSFLVGGLRHPIQTFNVRAARSNASMLMLGVGIAFVIPAIFATMEPHTSTALSAGTAIVSFVIYILGLLFALFTHRDLFAVIDSGEGMSVDDSKSHLKLWPALTVLLVATILVGMESDWLVESVRGVATRLGFSEVFIGVIVVAVIGNAAEHASAVLMAWKNRMDLSLEIAVGSSLQVAMFIAPVLFAVSLMVGHPMLLVFSWPELASMAAAVLLVVVLMVDGESNWLEGAMAVGAYFLMAVGFYTLPGVQ